MCRPHPHVCNWGVHHHGSAPACSQCCMASQDVLKSTIACNMQTEQHRMHQQPNAHQSFGLHTNMCWTYFPANMPHKQRNTTCDVTGMSPTIAYRQPLQSDMHPLQHAQSHGLDISIKCQHLFAATSGATPCCAAAAWDAMMKAMLSLPGNRFSLDA